MSLYRLLLFQSLLLFSNYAYADQPQAQAQSQTQSQTLAAAAAAPVVTPFHFILGTVNFFLLAFFVYYILVLRPQQLKGDQQSKFLAALKKGDEVMTSGGIVGKVTQVSPDMITLEISSGVKVRVLPEHVGAFSQAASAADKESVANGSKTIKAV